MKTVAEEAEKISLEIADASEWKAELYRIARHYAAIGRLDLCSHVVEVASIEVRRIARLTARLNSLGGAR